MTKETKQTILLAQYQAQLEENELRDEELEPVSGGNKSLLCTTMTNLASMRHEMLKAVANNLRS